MPLTHRQNSEVQFDRKRSRPLKAVRWDRYPRTLPDSSRRARVAECLVFQTSERGIDTLLRNQKFRCANSIG